MKPPPEDGVTRDVTGPLPRRAPAAAPPSADTGDGEVETPETEGAYPGRVIAGRYTLIEPIGSGAFGEVWTAADRVLQQNVALKWMRGVQGPRQARVRREITTLRLLQVPGVVRLLDEGVFAERPFLIMELVSGSPFPGPGKGPSQGRQPRLTWAEIQGPSLALLEVLARVHAAGVVHRDLKPDNVLVSAEGRPTVLDFGISLFRDAGDRLTAAGQVLGTPRYLAPEQLLGQPVDGRTDLYAVAVMLYRVLSGITPHEGPDLASMLRARLTTPATPLERLSPDVPIVVAQAIDRMLALRKEDRPRSASDAIAAFRGQSLSVSEGPALPRLGESKVVYEVCAMLLEGRSVDVVGAAGTGRSRCLSDVESALLQKGCRTVRIAPARSPFGSLRPLTGVPDEHATLNLSALSEWMLNRIQKEIDSGAIFLADDAEQIDRWSLAVLERCRSGPGAAVFCRLAAAPGNRAQAALSPLAETDMRPLFAGPDRLFHLRTDGARALWERTSGLPRRIEAEVTLWQRLGLVRREGEELVIERDALHRLREGFFGAVSPGTTVRSDGTEAAVHDLLCWLSLAGRHLGVRDLAKVVLQPVWAVEAELTVLLEKGLLRQLRGGRFEPRGHVDVPWSQERRIEAHRAIAAELLPADSGRLFHLLAGDEPLLAAREAVALAQRYAAEQGLGEAITALSEGLRAVREHTGEGVSSAEEVILLTEWVKMAFAAGTPGALDRVLYEISRCGSDAPLIARLDALLRAGLAAPGAGGLSAMEAADELVPFEDPLLERRRQRARIVAAAARVAPDLLDAVLEEVAVWAERTGHPVARLCLAEGKALLCYQQGRFEEAARLHKQAAELDPYRTGRIAATLNSASALLEAFRHHEAAQRAAEAQSLAQACREPYWEARAEWLLRSARYRTGEAREADHELCSAVARLGVPDLSALVWLNEAAVAMRAGDLSAAAELAGKAAKIWKEMARGWGALLARSLAIRCGAPSAREEILEMAVKASTCKLPGIGIQALALLAEALPEARKAPRDDAALTRGVPPACWSLRMDILSMDEALSLLGAPAGAEIVV